MESEGKITVAYWKIRGLFRHIQYVLEYCGADYDTKIYEAGGPPDYCRKVWFDNKFNLGLDFPNLPYLVDGDFKMTETVPIIFYIAEKYKPEILGETPQEKATIQMLMNIIHFEAKEPITWDFYLIEDRAKTLEGAIKAIEPIAKFLGDKDYFMGDKPMLPDLHIAELVHLVLAIDTEGEFAEKFPNIVALQKRVDNLPEIKAFLESDRCKDIPFHNLNAKQNP
ncbi:unnamed protein product [Moneuplotes crassus]|uniref:glutathione transferase n=1 Tax=Euplotes crassus TaxID=5936 RepID=A0AAD1XT94_EUPCR|nr:unnamed protein product [Moneuplotes crassus]